jgi:hypothetical protein
MIQNNQEICIRIYNGIESGKEEEWSNLKTTYAKGFRVLRKHA